MSRLNNLYLFLNDEKGRTLPRAKLFFYENNSFDFKNTYADKALTSVNPNPVIADGAGRFPNIFLEADTYRVVLQDEDGVEISTKDDVDNLLSDGDNVSNTTVTTSTGSQTVAGALDDRVVRVGSVAEGIAAFAGRAIADGTKFSVTGWHDGSTTGGHALVWDADWPKSEHGTTGWSPTVPSVSAQSGSSLREQTSAYRSGTGEADPGGTGGFVIVANDGILRPEAFGYIGEALVDGTQEYKGVTYDVKKWTLEDDFQETLDFFGDSSQYHTIDVGSLYLYVSGVSGKVWSGKTITGAGGQACGIIQGAINWLDGTKSARLTKIGFYGRIGLIDLPLPLTISESEKDDLDKFWVNDNQSWGYGFGALSVATASVTGNTDDIVVENCYFEMRSATISGGSAPDDEDRPKATNVVFRNNLVNNVMYHGFAGIHFKGAKAYGNHFENLYNGYACDLSLGCVECSFYSNTGNRLAAGMKAESRSFLSGNRDNEFYDNELYVIGEDRGFNAGIRAAGENSRFYDNSLTVTDFKLNTATSAVVDITDKDCSVESNKFFVEGTSNGLRNFFIAQDNSATGQTDIGATIIKRNEIHNNTGALIDVGLSLREATHDRITHLDNEYFGLWGDMIKGEFGGGTGTIGALDSRRNTFPNKALITFAVAFAITDIVSKDNVITVTNDNGGSRVYSLSFTTVTGKIYLGDVLNGGDPGSTDITYLNFNTATGSLADAEIHISGGDLNGLRGSLCYLFENGNYVPVKSVFIGHNNIIWKSASGTPLPAVLARGATKFIMANNTLVNEYSGGAGLTINRPTDSDDSNFEFNSTSGTVTDNPGAP